jgi:hypothetical protein
VLEMIDKDAIEIDKNDAESEEDADNDIGIESKVVQQSADNDSCIPRSSSGCSGPLNVT